MTPDLKVVPLDPPEYRRPEKMLRNIADDIEAGVYGDVSSLAVVLFGDTLEVFAGGSDASGSTAALMLQAGGLRIAREIEQHGR